MGNCIYSKFCNDETISFATEFLTVKTLSPSTADPEPHTLKLNPDQAYSVINDFSVECKKNNLLIFKSRRTLSNICSLENLHEALADKQESTPKFHRSLTRQKTGVKESFLHRAKEKLRRQTVLSDLNFKYSDLHGSEEPTSTNFKSSSQESSGKLNDENNYEFNHSRFEFD